MVRDEAKKIFNQLYQNENGFDISMKSRKQHNLTDKELTYGEVEFDSFWDILDSASLKKSEIFYDLGCGIAKPVIIAALHSQLKKSVGVELLPEVCEKAQDIANIFASLVPDCKTQILIRLEDITVIDFSEADIIFLPSTCFDEHMIHYFSQETKKLKKGSRIISLTKELSGLHLKMMRRKMYEMSWGSTTVHITEVV